MRINSTINIHINTGEELTESVSIRELYRIDDKVSDTPDITIMTIQAGLQEINMYYEDIKDIADLHKKLGAYLEKRGIQA
jgi:hypothetical protein